MTNTDLMVRMLEEAGVRWLFGIPSGPVLPLIDSLRQSSVQFILTASETSAGFMASAVPAFALQPSAPARRISRRASARLGWIALLCSPSPAT